VKKLFDPTADWPSIEFLGADIFLPNTSGVYIVLGENLRKTDNHYIYIGEAVDLKRRWKDGHDKALACIREDATTLRFFTTPQYKKLERVLIAYYEPTLNSPRSIAACQNQFGSGYFKFKPEEWQ
jgi:hypothetical protein